ncbi:MAG: M48 family metalloprotease [Bdellovibrionales bacterium]|nr:M48 family metalloprotease [Bdellovibrionales bacterium]
MKIMIFDKTQLFKTVCMFFLRLSLLSLLASSVQANPLSDFDWSNTLPPHLIDHYGFYPNKSASSQDAKLHLQLTPLIKGQKHYGFKVNPKVFGLSSKTATRHQVINYFKDFVEPITGQSYQLHPIAFNGNYYVISSKYAKKVTSIATMKSQCIGLCFDFLRPKTLYIGDVSTWGMSLNIGWSADDLRSTSGINLGESFSAIPQNIENIVSLLNQGPEVYETGFALINLYSFVNSQKLTLSADSTFTNNSPFFNYDYLLNYEHNIQATPKQIPLRLQDTDKSKKLFKTMQSLKDNLQPEIEWREKINPELTKIVNHQPVQTFIQDLCDYLATNYGVPEPVWPKCYVSASAAPNAYAYPGGRIFVTAGLLGMLNNLDSLLLVVGHEIGHVVARHTTKRLPIYTGFGLAYNAIALVQNIWAFQGGSKPLNKIPIIDNWYFNSLTSAAYSGYGIDMFMQIPIAGLMYHSRSNEHEADELGHEVAYSLGATNQAMADGWKSFEDFHKKLGLNQSFLDKLKSTHPTPESRQNSIKKRADAFREKLSAYNKTNRLAKSYYEEFNTIHITYKPLLDKYIEKVQSQSVEHSNYLNYYKHSFSQSQMSCIGHIFGANN